MSTTSADPITLTGSQRRALKRLVRAGRTAQRLVIRAEIVLAASVGESNAAIARSLGICEVWFPRDRGGSSYAACGLVL
ncbi:MAG TPA: hypothetical protein VEX40_14740, partial [Mycobacterium sp.]|nr:hypothetical protein [Mycobacterium sp.]